MYYIKLIGSDAKLSGFKFDDLLKEYTWMWTETESNVTIFTSCEEAEKAKGIIDAWHQNNRFRDVIAIVQCGVKVGHDHEDDWDRAMRGV